MRKSLMRMTLRQLQIFNEVCDLRSYSRAAEEMSLTQPAVSLQIRQLEERLGLRLFHRRPRGVELSAEGQRLALTVSEAYGSIDAELRRLDAGETVVRALRRSQFFTTP